MSPPTRGGSQPKIMSSRLAGMKFMQRTPGGTPSTPTSPATGGQQQPPAKRQRLSDGSSIASPQDSPQRPNVAETRWYLSFKPPAAQTESPLRIVSAGYSALDAAAGRDDAGEEQEDEVEVVPAAPGRKSFGKFNRKIEKAQNPDLSSSSSEDDDEDEDEDNGEDDDEDGGEDDDPVNALIAEQRKKAAEKVRAERKAEKKKKEAEAKVLAEQRRKREVNLNRVTSISGGGGGGGSGSERGLENIECYNCRQKGHRKQDCPKLEGRAPSKLRRY